MQNSLAENAPVKLETKSDEPGNAILRQLWKIRYLGEGYYGIRALYKPDRCLKVTSNAAKLHIVDTFDHISYFDDNALWKIEALGTGYALQNCGVTTSKQCLRPSGTDVVTSTFVSGNGAFTWTLTPNTIVPDLLILLDKDTARPINGSFHTLYEGETATLDDLNLMVSYVSQTKNEVDYYWQSSDSGVAYVNTNDEIVVCGRGETTISLHVSSSTNTPMYFVVDSPLIDDGVYYIRNWEYNRYIEINAAGADVYGFIFGFNPSYQQWRVTYLGDGAYSIQSSYFPGTYLGLINDSPTWGALIEPRSGTLTDGMKWIIEEMPRGGCKIRAYGTSSDLVIACSQYDDLELVPAVNSTACPEVSYEWLFCEVSNQIVPETQEKDKMCWVACAKMASTKYMRSPIGQNAASYYIHYSTRKLLFSGTEFDNVNRRGDAYQTSKAVEYILGWPGSTYYTNDRIYSETTLRSLLDTGNAVIISRARIQEQDGEFKATDGHAYLIFDYAYDATQGGYVYYIYDPSQELDNPLRIKSYSWICSAPDDRPGSNGEMMYWNWAVTFAFGDYQNTIKRLGPS